MIEAKETTSKVGRTAGSLDRPVRRVFSVNVPDRDLAIYMEDMGMLHPRGFSGWIRDLVTADRAEWIKKASVRERALRKLTDEERSALGYPPNISVSGPCPPAGQPQQNQRGGG